MPVSSVGPVSPNHWGGLLEGSKLGWADGTGGVEKAGAGSLCRFEALLGPASCVPGSQPAARGIPCAPCPSYTRSLGRAWAPGFNWTPQAVPGHHQV